MSVGVVGRSAELANIDQFLDSAAVEPASLLLEGDAGIGKTTLLLASVEAARQRGFTVLRCTGSLSDARLSHAGLDDLFRGVDIDAVEDLPSPQRDALDAALLRVAPGEESISPRAVAFGALAVFEHAAGSRPLLIAIDDLQWLDAPTADIVGFCSRRFFGPIGVIAARRGGAEQGARKASIAARLPERNEVVHLSALAAGAMTEMLRERLAGRISRGNLAQVSEASGGNPFFALELGEAIALGDSSRAALALPDSVEQLVMARTADLRPTEEKALLAVAALADPTIDLVERAVGEGAVSVLEQAESRALIRREGSRVRFAHPLLAHGIYAAASASQRREIHRQLSDVVSDIEERARHLAHAGVLPEAVTALEEAAPVVRARGSPQAAAELLELALELEDDPSRRLRAAEHHFDAGDLDQAGELAEQALGELENREERAHALLLLGEVSGHAGRHREACDLLERAQVEAVSIDRIRVAIAPPLAYFRFQLGDWKASEETARSMLAAAQRLGEPGRVAQASATLTMTEFCLGKGLNEDLLDEALRLEDPNLRTGNPGPPSGFALVTYEWAGLFEQAWAAGKVGRRLALGRREEPPLAWIAALKVRLACWTGDLDAARSALEEAEGWGLSELGQTGVGLALWARSLLEAYAGRGDEARSGAEESLTIFEGAEAYSFSRWPLTTLGFLELSAGNYEAAVSRLEAAAAELIATRMPEPVAFGSLFAGDAAEGLVAIGRIEEADELARLLEERGAALDRRWAIAVGARCRGLVLASRGEVESAAVAVEGALRIHERLPMPIERGRSLLTLGRILRRMRKRKAAGEALEQALEIFQAVDSPLWAEQARTEIDTLGLRPRSEAELTPAELRVATLVAGGMTNKEVASELVVSQKTVEAHLGRAFRKLEVHSRTELAARMAGGDTAAPS